MKYWRQNLINRNRNSLLLLIIICALPGLLWAQEYRIMPLGNSITHGQHGSSPLGGYRDDLAYMLLNDGISFNMVGTQYDGVSVYPYHEGHPGWETRLLINNITDYLRSTHPDVVMIHTGTNDINPAPESESAAYVQSRTSTLIDSIYAFDPDIVVLLASIIPRKGELNSEHEALGPLLQVLVESKTNAGYAIYYCPVYEMFTERSHWERMLVDDMHPNNDGYEIIANGFFKELMDMISAEDEVITDNFNRHKTVGWWTSRGDYAINNYKFNNTSENSAGYIAAYRFDDDPTAVSFTYGAGINPAAIGETGLALRLSEGDKDADGYSIIKESATNDLVLYHIHNGTLDYEIDRVAGLMGTPVENDTFKVALFSDLDSHYFDCYLNGRFDGRLTDPNRAEGNYSHQHAGVILTGSQNNVLDNFSYSYEEQTPYSGPGSIASISGEDQAAEVNSVAPEALTVEVLDMNGAPISGTSVAFRMTQGSGAVWTTTAGGLSALEAEFSELTAPMAQESTSEAAGGSYISTPLSGTAGQGTAELQVEIGQAGNYRVWGRVKGPDLNHRSFYFAVDDEAEITWQITADNAWHWDAVGELNGSDPKSFDLSAGRHTFKIRAGDPGVCLDRFVLTQNTGFTPADSPMGSADFYTDGNGRVSAQLILPKLAGSIQVEAFVPDFPSLIETFSASAYAGSPALLTKKYGDIQVGKPDELLPDPLRVQVSDLYGNTAQGVDVKFEVTAGSGTITEPQPVQTDAQGFAEIHYTLGPEAGENSLYVTCPGYISSGVTFTATAQKVLFSISGAVKYYNSQNTIPNVVLTVSGGMTASDLSNTSGNYEFPSVPKYTDFKVTPSRTSTDQNARATLDLYNASLIMRSVLGLESLSTFQQLAADVDQNGSISSYDAANIARFIVELPPAQENIAVGGWIFKPGTQSYSNIQVDLANQNYTGIMLGDVIGRWSNDLRALTKEVYASYHWPAPVLAAIGDTISLPFLVDQKNILSCDLFYRYNPDQVEFLDIQKTPVSSNFTVFHNDQNGQLQIAMFSPYYTTEAGEFLNVRFRLLQATASAESIVFEKYRLNADPFVIISSGVPLTLGEILPTRFTLQQNFPNPFSSSRMQRQTTIRYDIPKTGRVQVTIYNLLGQQIRTLTNRELPAGTHQIHWDGMDECGNETAAGVYIYQLKTENTRLTKRMLKIR